ncbi:hypothetical protein SPRG_20963 [Saprolegnia parasitica CBS 223.65]|uniref:MJ1316 RNA cyclic group end recognition domain-containing protein n=1 Tax=Saprolegnia parasitica (strain CBS 223.65) TaxID=695850 RepID=A0A067C3U6_SAPPC|nr:hypothetical protein SPRG_20963 [Saprolegnia parasitica CBS 223.65]KDO21191.1 hypothetical protein SPRG_20963 [Saprolegnia parasitica CBS 223.65]|eukprot:XP_012208112.1 hypothetical protein SPRG_20963 [Saprolegnia parasitica CBS 223.65]
MSCSSIQHESVKRRHASGAKKPDLSPRSSLNDNTKPIKPKKKAPVATSPAAEKKSMRTATDVIHRILWDDSITQTEVIVGYLDRFVGTVERNFAAFNWADIATLSQTETAIPQHRIQYFKWRDEIIWDKRVRLDRVFGSSGHDVIAFSPSTAAPAPLSAVAAERPANVTFHANTDRPNTFLCFRITDTAVVDTCKHAQAAIVRGDPRLAPSAAAALAPARFHCTLVRLRLHSLNVVQRRKSWFGERRLPIAKRVLAECQGLLHSLCASSIRIHGVSAFGNRVVYAKMAPHDGLMTLVATLKARFAAAGLSVVGSYDVYQPHLQLFKLAKDHCRLGTKINARSYAAYASHDFGSHSITSMHLCGLDDSRHIAPDGFYPRLAPPVDNVAPKRIAKSSTTYALKSPAVTSVHVFDFDLTLVRAPVRHHGESVLTPAEVASIGPDCVIANLVAPSHVTHLVVYEDDDAILSALTTWAAAFSVQRPSLEIRIIDAKRLLPAANPLSVLQLLKNLGCVPSAAHVAHTQHVLSELQRLSGAVHALPFGSHALGRKGDIDVCLVVTEPPRQAVANVAQRLRDVGISDVYESGSARCPLLKVRWLDMTAPPVELDIVFVDARVQ